MNVPISYIRDRNISEESNNPHAVVLGRPGTPQGVTALAVLRLE